MKKGSWVGWEGTTRSMKAILDLQREADNQRGLSKALNELVGVLKKLNAQVREINEDLDRIKEELNPECSECGHTGGHSNSCVTVE